jgi:hypothetical protein
MEFVFCLFILFWFYVIWVVLQKRDYNFVTCKTWPESHHHFHSVSFLTHLVSTRCRFGWKTLVSATSEHQYDSTCKIIIGNTFRMYYSRSNRYEEFVFWDRKNSPLRVKRRFGGICRLREVSCISVEYTVLLSRRSNLGVLRFEVNGAGTWFYWVTVQGVTYSRSRSADHSDMFHRIMNRRVPGSEVSRYLGLYERSRFVRAWITVTVAPWQSKRTSQLQ